MPGIVALIHSQRFCESRLGLQAKSVQALGTVLIT